MARTKQTARLPTGTKRQGKVARFGDNGDRPGTSSNNKQPNTGEQQAGTSSSERDPQLTGNSDPTAQNGQQTVSSVMEAFKEELICAICTDNLKQPKTLICSHTFCQHCLQSLMAQHDEEADIECPKCRRITGMEEHDGIVENLPTNLIAQNLVEKLEREGKKSSDAMKHKCSLHVDEMLRLYCETCKEVICRECALFVHCRPDHVYVNLGDFVNKKKYLTLKKMHQLFDKNQELKSQFEEYERYHQDWMMCTKRAEFWVKKSANVVREKIDKDERQKLGLIKDKQHSQNIMFKNYGDNFSSLLQKISKALHSQADLAKIPDIEYLAKHDTLIEKVDHLLQHELPSFDSEAWHYSVIFDPNEALIDQEFSLGTVSINMGETCGGMARLNSSSGGMVRLDPSSRNGTKHGVKRPRESVNKNEDKLSSERDAATEECPSTKKQAGTLCGCKKSLKATPSQQDTYMKDLIPDKSEAGSPPTNGQASIPEKRQETTGNASKIEDQSRPSSAGTGLGNDIPVSSSAAEETIEKIAVKQSMLPKAEDNPLMATEGNNKSKIATHASMTTEEGDKKSKEVDHPGTAGGLVDGTESIPSLAAEEIIEINDDDVFCEARPGGVCGDHCYTHHQEDTCSASKRAV